MKQCLMRVLSGSMLFLLSIPFALAYRPDDYMRDPDLDGVGGMPIAGSITLLAMIWLLFGKGSPAPVRAFAEAYPGWAVVVLLGVPIGIGFLFR